MKLIFVRVTNFIMKGNLMYITVRDEIMYIVNKQ